jgi:hypothetical protein
MRFHVLRRWFALCAILALSLGLVAHGVAAAQMDAKMMTAAAAGEMSPSSGGCDGCGSGDDGMSAIGCFALCGGTVAVLPSVAPLTFIAVERTTPRTVRSDPGRVGPPDPYPPRSSVLS